MATWTEIATIAAGYASGKPGIGVGGFGDQITGNLQYLKDLIDQFGVPSDQAIHDDFTADQLSLYGDGGGAFGTGEAYTWEQGGTVPTMAANPDHWVLAQHAIATYSVMAASPYKMRFDLSRDHTVVFETRHRSGQSDAAEVWAIGFQDAALAVGAATIITDQSDFIGFRQGGAANTYDAITASGGATTVVANDAGAAAVWTKLKAVVTFAGATQNVEFFIDDVSVGTTTSTITAVRLRPVIGCSGGSAGSPGQYFDYVHAFWRVRPLSA
jgi:hypothetical protein